jgi:hypothetical protein
MKLRVSRKSKGGCPAAAFLRRAPCLPHLPIARFRQGLRKRHAARPCLPHLSIARFRQGCESGTPRPRVCRTLSIARFRQGCEELHAPRLLHPGFEVREVLFEKRATAAA